MNIKSERKITRICLPASLWRLRFLDPHLVMKKENVMFLKTERFLTTQIKTTRYVGRVQVLFNKSPSKTHKTVNITEKICTNVQPRLYSAIITSTLKFSH